MGCGCSRHPLVGNVGIRLPSISAHSLGPKESKGRAGGVNSGGSLVGDKVVDTGASGVESRVALNIASLEDPSGPAMVLKVPRQSRVLQASHLEIIAEGIKNVGFSKEVVARVATGKLRATSVKVL